MSRRNNNAAANIQDYKLSRYICYLIVQNADPNKEIVALGQTYFAIQTRKQEITEQEYDSLSDTEKRFYQRRLTKQGNYTLQKVASAAGVKNMAEFHKGGNKMISNKLETISNLFEGKEIRSVWDSEREEYYFSVVDVIGALTDSKEPRKYWSVLKNRLKK